jgi:predicted ester cyclase
MPPYGNLDLLKLTVQRALENWNKGDLNGYLEMYDPGCNLYGYDGVGPGLAGIRKFYEDFWGAFPHSHITIGNIIGEGDKVALDFTLRAVHEGNLMGIPPTGKSVTVAGATILRFANGKCIERYSQTDFMGLLKQLGVMPG